MKDKELPVTGGVLWNSFLLPGRRAGTHLDLKASSHKKLSKLLQVKFKAYPAVSMLMLDSFTLQATLLVPELPPTERFSVLSLQPNTRRSGAAVTSLQSLPQPPLDAFKP